jgi:tetratricopeptide (TPR) repeat protein
MIRSCRLHSVLVLLVGLTLGAGAAQAQPDQVTVRGAPVSSKGTITEMTKDAVTLETNNVPRQIAVNEIVKVSFGDEPIELANSRNALNQRNFKIALDELKKLEGQTFSRFIAADIGYYRALTLSRQALTAGGEKPAALTALFDWVRANPTNYHFYEAAEVLGDLAVATGQYADAARFYGGLSAAPWPDYQFRGNIAVGRALVAEKKYAEALQRFEAVIASNLTSGEAEAQKQLATVGKAVCLAETGKAEEGIAILNEIIAKNNPEEQKVLFARTYNALGACHLKLNRPKEALQAFLFTDILFDADADAHAEALYHLGKLWTEVNKRDYADQARSTLKQQYAGSVWATLP